MKRKIKLLALMVLYSVVMCAWLKVYAIWVGQTENSLKLIGFKLYDNVEFRTISNLSFYKDPEIKVTGHSTLPLIIYQNQGRREIEIIIQLFYQADRTGPFKPLTDVNYEITPNFQLTDSIYITQRPPGYTVRMWMYCFKDEFTVQEIGNLVEEKLVSLLPITYERRKYFPKHIPGLEIPKLRVIPDMGREIFVLK